MRALWSDRQVCSHNVSQKVKRIRRFSELFTIRKRAEYCFESTVSEKRTHRASLSFGANSVSSEKNSVSLLWHTKNRLGGEELTELSPRNSVAKKLTDSVFETVLSKTAFSPFLNYFNSVLTLYCQVKSVTVGIYFGLQGA